MTSATLYSPSRERSYGGVKEQDIETALVQKLRSYSLYEPQEMLDENKRYSARSCARVHRALPLQLRSFSRIACERGALMLILYTSDDGKSRIQLRAYEHTVWLTQLEMAEPFATAKQNVSLYLKNLFEGSEFNEGSVVEDSLTTASDDSEPATVKQSLTVAVKHRSQPTAEKSSAVGSAERVAATRLA